jgi:hypothetical protein
VPERALRRGTLIFLIVQDLPDSLQEKSHRFFSKTPVFISRHPPIENNKEDISMSEPAPSPLARLVMFMICLAIAGSILAGAHYYAIDLPAQQAALHAPANARISDSAYNTCMLNCLGDPLYYKCISMCDVVG